MSRLTRWRSGAGGRSRNRAGPRTFVPAVRAPRPGISEGTMCGIVGILGSAPVADSIVEALKRLEYRGYDSAGIATLEGGHLTRRRAEGKLKNLELRLSESPLQGVIGIGHTRWATHGRPSEANAHPHASDRLAVVHNGIIENFRELREELR